LKDPPHFVRALHSREDRVCFSGQWVSLLGNWIATTGGRLLYPLSAVRFSSDASAPPPRLSSRAPRFCGATPAPHFTRQISRGTPLRERPW